MQPTTEEITKRGYIEGPNGVRYPIGSTEATNYLLSQGKLPPQVIQQSTPMASNGAPTGLLGFKDTVSQIVNLAKEKRNALSLGLMTPHSGNVAASDFSSILGNLNKASDTFTQDVTKNLLEEDANKELKAETIGGFEVLRDATGKVISTRSVGSDDDDKVGDFALAKSYIAANPGLTNEELTADLLENSDLGVSEINALIGSRPTTNQEKTELTTIAQALVDSQKKSTDGDLVYARAKAIEVLNLGQIKIGTTTRKFSDAEIKALKKIILTGINNFTQWAS